MIRLRNLLIVLVLSLSSADAAPPVPGKEGGVEVGGGGSHIRQTFIDMGRAILKYFREDESGKAIAEKHGLNLDRLERSLEIKKIKPLDKVWCNKKLEDACSRPGSIKLDRDRWAKYFEQKTDVYYLVLHEMCREAGKEGHCTGGDDKFEVSDEIRPFPKEYWITAPQGYECSAYCAGRAVKWNEKKHAYKLVDYCVEVESAPPVRPRKLSAEGETMDEAFQRLISGCERRLKSCTWRVSGTEQISGLYSRASDVYFDSKNGRFQAGYYVVPALRDIYILNVPSPDADQSNSCQAIDRRKQ